MSYKPCLLAFLVLVLITGNLFSQEKDRSGIVEDDEKYYGKRMALIIGIDYRENESLENLDHAKKDAGAIKKILEENYGFECVFLPDSEATRSKILEQIKQIKDQLNRDDAFLFYFAGHGKSEGNLNYLLPANIEDTYSLQNGAVDVLGLINGKTKAKHCLYILDSCYSGGSLNWIDKIFPPQGIIERHSFAHRSVQIITSSGKTEEASDGSKKIGHSPFATSFIDYLELPAKQQEIELTAYGLSGFVKQRFSKNYRQNPQFAEAKISSPVAGDFHFLLTQLPETRMTKLHFQTLSGSPGKWWFSETPWLTPKVRLELDSKTSDETNKENGEFIDPSNMELQKNIWDQVQELNNNDLKSEPLSHLLETATAPEEKKSLIGLALNELPETSRGNSTNTATDYHLKALLLHSQGKKEPDDPGDIYAKAISAYSDKLPGLKLRCFLDKAMWHLSVAGKACCPDEMRIQLKLAEDCYKQSKRILDRELTEEISHFTFIECLNGHALVYRKMASLANSRDETRRLFKKSEDLYKKCMNIVWPDHAYDEHGVRGYLAERMAWTLMDQWKHKEALDYFKQAQSVWECLESVGNPKLSLYAFSRRTHAEHGIATAERLGGSYSADRYQDIIEEINERIIGLSDSQKAENEDTELFKRFINTTERMGDSFLYQGRITSAEALQRYKGAHERLLKMDLEANRASRNRINCKQIIAATLCGQIGSVERAFERLEAEKQKNEESIYFQLAVAFRKMTKPRTLQEGLNEIRSTIAQNNRNEDLVSNSSRSSTNGQRRSPIKRDEQELLLLVAELVGEEQQRIDANAIELIVTEAERKNASRYFRSKHENSILVQSRVVRSPKDFEDLAKLIQLTKHSETLGLFNRSFASFILLRSKNKGLLLLSNSRTSKRSILEFDFDQSDVDSGLAESTIAKVNSAFREVAIPDQSSVFWMDDGLPPLKSYPFDSPKNPNLK